MVGARSPFTYATPRPPPTTSSGSPSGAANAPSTSAACSNDSTSNTWLPIWACTPTSSTPPINSSAATASVAAPDVTENPNFVSSWPVRTNSWVWASTPGVTRTSTAGRADRPGAVIGQPAEPGDLVERVDHDPAHPDLERAGQLGLGLVVPVQHEPRRGHAGRRVPPRARLRWRRPATGPPRGPAAPSPCRGTPSSRRRPLHRRRRAPPGSAPGCGPRRRRTAACRAPRRERGEPHLPLTAAQPNRPRRCPEGGGVRGGPKPPSSHQVSGRRAALGHGRTRYGERLSPSSSADRAPASGAGCAGSSPAWGAV